jgi:Protein of unknown function (DUF1524)
MSALAVAASGDGSGSRSARSRAGLANYRLQAMKCPIAHQLIKKAVPLRAPWNKFQSKRNAFFRESNLHLNRELMQLEQWDEDAITQRGRAMFEIALRVWPGPKKV